MVKKIAICVMRMVRLLNQLVISPKEILAPVVSSCEVESLRTHYNLVDIKKVDIEKDSLEMWGCLEMVSLLFEEERLHGS